MTTVIVEDEPLARERMRVLLAAEPGFVLAGEAADGATAVRLLDEVRPELVLLDIELPELNGFEVLQALAGDALPRVIFVTAYDRHAVRAFEVHALDYLLKPVEPERFRAALARVRDGAEGDERARRLREAVAEAPGRIVVRSGGRILFLRPEEIDWIDAVGNYVKIHRGGESFLLRQTMTAMEERLARARFARIQRSTIVNVDRIAELRHEGKDAYLVVLTTGGRFPLSIVYRHNLEQLLGDF